MCICRYEKLAEQEELSYSRGESCLERCSKRRRNWQPSFTSRRYYWSNSRDRWRRTNRGEREAALILNEITKE